MFLLELQGQEGIFVYAAELGHTEVRDGGVERVSEDLDKARHVEGQSVADAEHRVGVQTAGKRVYKATEYEEERATRIQVAQAGGCGEGVRDRIEYPEADNVEQSAIALAVYNAGQFEGDSEDKGLVGDVQVRDIRTMVT